MSANLFDIIFIVILGLAAWQGYTKGLIATAASLAVLLIGVWAAIHFSDAMSGWLKGFIHIQEKYITIMAFVFIFILVAIAIGIMGKILEGIIDAASLSVTNKVFGSAFGVLKAALIWSILIAVLNVIPFGKKVLSAELKDKSLFYSSVSKFAPTVFSKLDFEKTQQLIEEKIDAVDL